MELLNGAVINLYLDPEKKLYRAWVGVGSTSKEAYSKDPVRALGLAVMLQAGFTEETLKEELKKNIKPFSMTE